jgi:tail assembly chaperone E/41/14-like protein
MSDKNPMTEKVALDFPIQVNGKELTEVEVRRPSVGDQIAASHNGNSQAEQEVYLFASLAKMSPSDMHQMDLKDYTKIQALYKSFLS